MTTIHSVTNSHAWDLRTGIHLTSSFYNVDGFLAGQTTLHEPELQLLPDVHDKHLLHLQCHFGLDTMSWSRLGAHATGVDFSTAAIEAASDLSHRSGLMTEFVQADVQHLDQRIAASAYDIVFSSYGVLCWLQDLDAWAAGIYRSLRCGGRFVLVEFHPVLDLLFEGKVSGSVDYCAGAPVAGRSRGTYTDPEASIEYLEYRWQHPISEVLTALMAAGLHLEGLQELPYCPYRLFPSLDRHEGGLWYSTGRKVPYLYTVVAIKPKKAHNP